MGRKIFTVEQVIFKLRELKVLAKHRLAVVLRLAAAEKLTALPA